MSRPSLSVVIPAFNEAQRLPATLARVHAFLEARGGSYQVLVVDDGSTDGTAEVARAGPGSVEVLRHAPEPRQGLRRARGHAGRHAASGA